MKSDDLANRMRQGGVALAFDTNAVYDDRGLFNLCDQIALYNIRHDEAARPRIRLLITAVAYAEKLFDLKQRFREKFDIKFILEGLARKRIEFQAFDANHALETAERLGRRFPTDAAWHEAKRKRYLQSLNLPENTTTPGTGKSCGATIDWLVGGHAEAEGAILVTNDQGPEFHGIDDRVRLQILKDVVDQLLAEPV